jgi:glutamate/tyrosine decarboxylase-like PLP-dependent enzyme/mannose-6-phosphate isomerase-like protein (cupin superfamily)
MNVTTFPPGASSAAHEHRDFETAIYGVRGEVTLFYGPRLEHSVVVGKGDFCFIAPGVPHKAYNLSDTETALFVTARNDPVEQENVLLTPEAEDDDHIRRVAEARGRSGTGARGSAEPEIGELDAAVADLARRFRDALEPPFRAGADVDAATMRALLDEQLPERGTALVDVLGALVERVEPGLAGTTGGRYLGYVTGGLLPSAAIAQAWAVAVDQNPGLWALAPAATELEQVVLGWLVELLELPGGGATFTSGAAGANLVCLAVARHWAGGQAGVDVNRGGVGRLPPLAVYGSSELHFTNVKALRILGLGEDSLRHVAVDEAFRLDVAALERAIAADRAAGLSPAIVIAHAAAANTGACDPLRELAALCEREQLWLHVDGAFGAFLRLCERTAALVDGIDLADSVAVDGHKWLNLPSGIGFAFLRDSRLHRETFAGTAAYLTPAPGAGLDLHELGVEASRPWRGAATWAALVHLGREGVAEIVTRCCDIALELGRIVDASPSLELTAPVASCVTCFRYRPPGTAQGERLDSLNRRIQQQLAREGVVLATGGMLPSGFSLRPAIVSWRTTLDDVAVLAREVERLGDELSGS